MSSLRIADFSNHARISRQVAGKNVILRGVSALEYMGLFVGYVKAGAIEIYAEVDMSSEGFDSRVVENLNQIDYFDDGLVLCSTLNQVVNDMLSEFETMDDVALAESLAYHYEKQGSFESLNILPQYSSRFEEMKDWAREYYYGG